MSNKFPEIRPDLTYELVAPNLATYLAWRVLYASLSNVKVTYEPKEKK
jgi:hypothetical protein